MVQPPPLSDTHRRILGVLVRLVETQLLEAEQLLALAAPGPAASQPVVDDLSPAERARLHEIIAAVRAEIGAFHARYGLPSQPVSLRHLLSTKASVLWEQLEDSRSGKLRGYGLLDAATAQDLDATLTRLVDLTNQLAPGA
ncbi:hypothetical protein [Hymenobacter metallilatus]|uniref:Uncharacterized protein n=1 Tax=Hymenobacter metallilatus TaxID=2493666 RepID=A0A3R9NZL4_9BACT|nr:hypothetical protein [Hymenobacter metallilatus]RSK24979.1 hypothetical protein EI290_18320 [Hymenobacter metallilatus]